MLTYILRRLLLMIPTFLGLTYLVYAILCWAPGGPLEQRLAKLTEEGAKKGGKMAEVKLTPELYEELRKQAGFTDASPQEYLKWLAGICGFEFSGWKKYTAEFVKEGLGDYKKNAKGQYVTELNQVIYHPESGSYTWNNWAVDFPHDGKGKYAKDADGKFLIIRHAEWISPNLKFTGKINMGQSSRFNQPVLKVIFNSERITIALFFGIASLIIAYLICVPLGVAKAIRHGKLFDSFSSVMIFIGYAIPGWVVGTMLLLLLASKFHIFPLGNFKSDGFEEMTGFAQFCDISWHMTLPLTAYVLGIFAGSTFLMKNSIMDNLSSDYVRTALAKGNTFKAALWKHAFRNSLIPLAAGLGHAIGIIVSGSYLIEKVFNLNGFGKLSLDAVEARDYSLCMGMLVVTSLLLLIGNLLSDLFVAMVDPRVKYD